MLLRHVKRRLAALLPPCLFLAVAGYFLWNAVHGQGGLVDQQREAAQLATAQAQYATIDTDRLAWETRIDDLSGQSVTPDMLDAQARRVLNLADPSDLVVGLTAHK
jgi:cell division protein FtsB